MTQTPRKTARKVTAITPALEKAIVTAYKGGATSTELQQTLHVAWSTARRILTAYGVTIRPSGAQRGDR